MDGDSLGSAIALDYILTNTQNSLYCPIDIPQYLHYFDDWSRVSSDFDSNFKIWKCFGKTTIELTSLHHNITDILRNLGRCVSFNSASNLPDLWCWGGARFLDF